tara:strand:- start:2031 stop:2981 length:951 start_codon:yes stop_codon:yes gene_type:complete
MNQKLTIIMYHFVRELHKTRYPYIKGLLLSEFKQQISYLKRHYTFINISDCINSIHNNQALPPNAVLLTFDDGYIDHFENVFPILKKNNIQGCFFPPAKAIIEEEVLDVNKIHFILASMSKNINDLINEIYSELDVFRSDYNLKSNEYYFSKLGINNRFDSGEIIFIKRLLQVELDEELRSIIVDKLFKKYVSKDERSFSKELYMNVNQIRYMVENGMYIGSHGYNHYWLDKLNKDKQRDEIVKSIKFLKTVNSPTKNWIMCYPYGAYNKSLIKILKEKGCALGFTTKVDFANLSKKNAFTLSRFDTNDFYPKASQ